MSAGTYNFTIEQGTTFSRVLTFTGKRNSNEFDWVFRRLSDAINT